MVHHIDPLRAKERFIYNPETGTLIHRPKTGDSFAVKYFNTRCANKLATFPVPQADKRISNGVYFCGKTIFASRIIYAIMTGESPTNVIIDHRDGNPMNDKWANLRAASYSENSRNKKRQCNNKAGYAGVYIRKDRPGFVFSVKGADGRRHTKGGFRTALEAAMARDELARVVHGKFFRASASKFPG